MNVIDAAYDDGQVTCQFSFEITTEQADGEPAPIVVDKNYYLIFAAGILKGEGRCSSKQNQTIGRQFAHFSNRGDSQA